MKTIVLCFFFGIGFFVIGCSKAKTTTSARDKFVGNYHMHDYIVVDTFDSGGVITKDTLRYAYTLSISSLQSSNDKIILSNVGNCGTCRDTATVADTIASNVSVIQNFATATKLTDSTLLLQGGSIYSGSVYSGGTPRLVWVGEGFGTKQ